MTLVEVLMSLGIVLIGMLALFRIIGSSIAGTATSSRINQAQSRATLILENMRAAPTAALDCLLAQQPSSWAACETACRTAQSMSGAPADKCIYLPSSMSTIPGPAMASLASGFDSNGQAADRSQQQYGVVYTGTFNERDTYARLVGTNLRVVEMQVTIGWNDDNTTGAIATSTTYQHVVSFRTGVFK